MFLPPSSQMHTYYWLLIRQQHLMLLGDFICSGVTRWAGLAIFGEACTLRRQLMSRPRKSMLSNEAKVSARPGLPFFTSASSSTCKVDMASTAASPINSTGKLWSLPASTLATSSRSQPCTTPQCVRPSTSATPSSVLSPTHLAPPDSTHIAASNCTSSSALWPFWLVRKQTGYFTYQLGACQSREWQAGWLSEQRV